MLPIRAGQTMTATYGEWRDSFKEIDGTSSKRCGFEDRDAAQYCQSIFEDWENTDIVFCCSRENSLDQWVPHFHIGDTDPHADPEEYDCWWVCEDHRRLMFDRHPSLQMAMLYHELMDVG